MAVREAGFDLFSGKAVIHASGALKRQARKAAARVEFQSQVRALVAQATAEDPERGLLIEEALGHLHRDTDGEFRTMEDIAIRSGADMQRMLNKLRNVI